MLRLVERQLHNSIRFVFSISFLLGRLEELVDEQKWFHAIVIIIGSVHNYYGFFQNFYSFIESNNYAGQNPLKTIVTEHIQHLNHYLLIS